MFVHGADLCEAGTAVAASVSLLSRVYSQVVPVNNAVKDPGVTWQIKLLVNDSDCFVCLEKSAFNLCQCCGSGSGAFLTPGSGIQYRIRDVHPGYES